MARLGDICKINMGQSPDSSTYNADFGGLPFFQGNADFGDMYPVARVWCSSPTKIAEPNDILISVRAPIGALNIAKETCCIGRGLAALTVDKSVCNQKYLWYAIESKVPELISKGTGSTFKAIGKSVLYETEINLLPLSEQDKVVSIMDSLTKLIKNTKTYRSKLDELVKSRFIELFGSYYGNNEQPLNAVCNFIDYRGKTPEKTDSGVPLITAKNVKNNAFSIEPQEFIPADNYDAVMTRGFPRHNDVLFTTEAPLGNVCRIPPIYERFCVGQRIVTMQPNDGVLTAEYLEYALLSKDFQDKMWQKSSGSTVKGIRSKLLEWLTIPVPPIDLQNEFAAFVEQTDKLKLAVKESLEKLETLKKSLMQEYFG